VNCICVNKQWYISFAEEGEEGTKKKKKDNVPLLMATEKTTEIKSYIFFSYRA
jgi:hypothetical protein